MIYAVRNSADFNADLVIKKDDKIYACYLNPSKVDHNSNTPVEQQPAWRIERIETYASDGAEYTRTMYPNGNNTGYQFCPAEVETYTYDYQH